MSNNVVRYLIFSLILNFHQLRNQHVVGNVLVLEMWNKRCPHWISCYGFRLQFCFHLIFCLWDGVGFGWIGSHFIQDSLAFSLRKVHGEMKTTRDKQYSKRGLKASHTWFISYYVQWTHCQSREPGKKKIRRTDKLILLHNLSWMTRRWYFGNYARLTVTRTYIYHKMNEPLKKCNVG